MRLQSFVRENRLRRLAAEFRISEVYAIEMPDGHFAFVADVIPNDRLFLTTYRKRGCRTFACASSVWSFCNELGFESITFMSSSTQLAKEVAHFDDIKKPPSDSTDND